MKILLLDVNYDHSSTGKIVADLKHRLEADGHTVLACYGRDVGALESDAVRISSLVEVRGHVALTRITGLTGGFSPFATRKLIELIDEFSPDVVHLHELHGYYINIDAVVDHLKKRKIPTVWTFHCEFMYTGKCGYAYECEQWKTQCVQCPQLSDYPISWFFDRTAFMFNEKKRLFKDFDSLQIVTPSHWLADRVRQSFLKDRHIDVIYNGIDVEKTFVPCDTTDLRKELGIRSRYVIVTIGPDLMSDRKGGLWVLEVAKTLAAEDITFVMVGVERPEEISMPNVIAIPKLSDQNLLAQYYSLGDYFLLTSKKETFSLACAESLACGTPIIGFDSGAPTEVAPAGYGYFVDYGNIEQLSSAIVSSLNDPSSFQSRQQCASYARSYFGKETMFNAYMKLYSTIQ
jgi:putative colanic acid biosynthesis glycosyltransferase